MKDVVIIGAGASGLMCAAGAARRGRSVLVIDRNNTPAIKLRATGGGRCNFTNLDMGPEHYVSCNPHFVKSALARFGPEDFTALLDNKGIEWEEREQGRLFCTGPATALALMLHKEALGLGVDFALGGDVLSATRQEERFIIHAARQGMIEAGSLVIATGGLSYENLGASSIGMDIARGFGLDITPTRPALVPFVLSRDDRAIWGLLSGISHRVRITCHDGHSILDDLLITHRGLSGPAGLRASLRWIDGRPLLMDFLPAMDALELLMSHRSDRMELKTLLSRHMPLRLAELLARICNALRPMREISERDLRVIAERLARWEIVPAGTEGWDKAEVTRGGVSTSAISSKSMEARDLPGLFFIGEVLDVTGDLGGYNLHWAWASAHAAGSYV